MCVCVCVCIYIYIYIHSHPQTDCFVILQHHRVAKRARCLNHSKPNSSKVSRISYSRSTDNLSVREGFFLHTYIYIYIYIYIYTHTRYHPLVCISAYVVADKFHNRLSEPHGYIYIYIYTHTIYPGRLAL